MEVEIISFVDWHKRNPLDFSIEWKTDVVEYDSGENQRNAVWERPRRWWTINWNNMFQTERDRLWELFCRAKGAFREFLLLDGYDYAGSCDFAQTVLPITALDQTTKTFTVAGDHLVDFNVGKSFVVSGSTGNDGTYTVSSATYDTSTEITVEEAIPSAVVDGNIFHVDFQIFKVYYPDTSESWSENKRKIVANSYTVYLDGVLQVDGVDYTVDLTEGILTFLSPPANGQVIEVSYQFYFPVTFTADSHTATKVAPDFWAHAPVQLVEVK